MKTTFTLLALCILAIVGLNAQNPLMKEFGSSYQEVQKFLESRNCKLTTEQDLILVHKGTLILEYHFQDDHLYQMTIEKVFDRRKDSEEAMDAFRNHYNLVGAELIEMEEGRKKEFFVAIAGRDLNEVTRYATEADEMRVQLVSRNFDFYPMEQKRSLSEEIKSYSPAFTANAYVGPQP